MGNFSRPLTLASNSPRRKQLLEDAGFTVKVTANRCDESYPSSVPPEEVAEYLARKKAAQFNDIENNEIVITADTTVLCNGLILDKPEDYKEAFRLLEILSGNAHEVITGVCIRSDRHQVSFSETTRVIFRQLDADEIDYYLSHFFPYDKAGAYGIQEWIGMIGVERIEGSYYNVVGLPVHRVWECLMNEFPQ